MQVARNFYCVCSCLAAQRASNADMTPPDSRGILDTSHYEYSRLGGEELSLTRLKGKRVRG